MFTAATPGHGTTEGHGRRRWQIGAVAALALATTLPAALMSTTAAAAESSDVTVDTGGNYVTTSTTPQRSIDLSAVSPTCIAQTPYISYTIVPTGFTTTGPFTLSFFDRNGNFVEQRTVTTLSGNTVYPGASVNPPDWPGWKQADNGNWIPDPSDSFLREGLTVTASLQNASTISDSATVSYVDPTSPCANPPHEIPPTTTICSSSTTGGGSSGSTGGSTTGGGDCNPPTTTICTSSSTTGGTSSSSSTGGDDCPPCTPGSSAGAGSSSSTGGCSLPRTGGGPGKPLIIGIGALLAGLLLLGAARRKHDPDPAAG